MTGWKEWGIGEVVEAGDFQTYVQDQTVQNYATSAARGSALGTAVAEGMVSYLQDSNTVEVYDGSAWVQVGNDLSSGTAGYTALSNGTAGLSYQPVSHNYIINGAFDINQRGFSSSTSGAYTFDRWLQGRNGGTVTATAEAFTPADLEAIGYGEAENYFRQEVAGQSAVGDYAQFQQRTEDVRTLAGQTITVSFYAKANSGTPSIAIDMNQSFGSGGSSTVSTVAGKVAITTSWAKYSISVTLPSISGKTIGTGSHLRTIFWTSAGSNFDSSTDSLGIQNNTFDIWGVQLEAGSIATPFKRNAPSLQGELAACQRYYLKLLGNNNFTYGNGWTNSSTVVRAIVNTPVTMRTDPTITFSDGYVYSNGNFSAFGAITEIKAASNGVQFTVAVTGLTASHAAVIRLDQDTEFSAEL